MRIQGTIMFGDVKYLLNQVDFKIVKIMSLSLKKYIMYREDNVKNVVVISNNNLQDLLQDIIYFFDKQNAEWYLDMVAADKSDAVRFSTAVGIVQKFLKYKVPRVNKLINDPGEDVFFSENATDYFNLFQSAELIENVPTEEKDWSVIHDILYNLCGQNEEVYDWVFNWFAVLYQNPAYRFSTSVIFVGAHGSGKGMFANALAKIFDNTCYRANSKDLTSTFNSQLFEGKYLVLCNEIVDQKNTYQFSNDLKEFVTEKQISIEAKYSDRYMAKNYIKLILFSNDNNPIYIERNDRRYLVAKSKKLDMPYDTRHKYWEDEDFFNSQVDGFCYALSNTIVNYEQVTTEPIMTEAKNDIINNFTTDFNATIKEIIEDHSDMWEKHITGSYYINYGKVYAAYNQTAYKKIHRLKFGSKLRAEGFIVDTNSIDSVTCVRIKVSDEIYEATKPKEYIGYKYNVDVRHNSQDVKIELIKKEYTRLQMAKALGVESTDDDEIVKAIKMHKKQDVIYEPRDGVYKFV